MITEQLTLGVHLPSARLRTPARGSDPDTSHVAARRLRESGQLSRQLAETLAALRAYPGHPTSAELAHGDPVLRYRYARRLADLKRLGFVTMGDQRTCTASGRTAWTWRVAQVATNLVTVPRRPHAPPRPRGVASGTRARHAGR